MRDFIPDLIKNTQIKDKLNKFDRDICSLLTENIDELEIRIYIGSNKMNFYMVFPEDHIKEKSIYSIITNIDIKKAFKEFSIIKNGDYLRCVRIVSGLIPVFALIASIAETISSLDKGEVVFHWTISVSIIMYKPVYAYIVYNLLLLDRIFYY